MQKVRFGIIGCGQISQLGHIPNLRNIKNAEITVLSDISDENIRKALEMVPEAKVFNDYRALLKQDDVDVAVIATPNWLHCEQVVASMEAGKDVFCEKPLGINIEECERIKGVLKKTGSFLQIGHELRHSKVFETAKEKIEEDIIGEVKILRYNEFRKPLLQGWRQTGKTGGIMLEKNSHFFDLFNWFAEAAPVKVMGIGSNDVNKESPLIDNCYVLVEYENGIKAQLTMCLFCENGGQNGMEVIGSKGMLRINGEILEIYNRESSEKIVQDCTVTPKECMHFGCRRELEALIECRKENKIPLNNINNAIETLKLAKAAEDAITTRSIITIK
ncbi:MAG: hypothetical protein A2017_21890 [Lentisphaerae bacterium GWF2_44_16]|nr:MAG: hypothetical protein A2017_21890 [Lentisphaerae bacterium GWF2_44_16]